MAIACAYCNGEHDTPAEVRQCWTDGGEQQIPVDDAPLPEPELFSEPDTSRRSASSSAPQRTGPPARTRPAAIERGVAPAGPGPDVLARNVVVDAGGAIPDAWVRAQRIVIDATVLDAPGPTAARLRAAQHAGERMVIELGVAFEREPMLMTDTAPHDLGPRFVFELETLHQLVWANSVDARDPDRPVWIGLDTAIAAGAAAADRRTGDVVLPDGTTAWLDGGPVRHHDPIDGVPVVHVIAAEHGSLTPPGPNESDADLAPDQLAAVIHPGGGARIIAPAGSGKTASSPSVPAIS